MKKFRGKEEKRNKLGKESGAECAAEKLSMCFCLTSKTHLTYFTRTWTEEDGVSSAYVCLCVHTEPAGAADWSS